MGYAIEDNEPLEDRFLLVHIEILICEAALWLSYKSLMSSPELSSENSAVDCQCLEQPSIPIQLCPGHPKKGKWEKERIWMSVLNFPSASKCCKNIYINV
jgi:hypothetical protein